MSSKVFSFAILHFSGFFANFYGVWYNQGSKIFCYFKIVSSSLSLSQKDKLVFIENLGTLLNSGIPVMKALQIILFQAKTSKVRALAEHLSKSIETGESFFRVAAKLPKIFSVFDVAILEM